MHARKLPRISEPSFDKDYSHTNSYDGGGNTGGGKNNYTKYTPHSSAKEKIKNSSGFGGSRAGEDYLYRRSLSPDSRQDSPRGLNAVSRRGGGDSSINKGFSRNTRDRTERDSYYSSSKYSNSRNERDNERASSYLERNLSSRRERDDRERVRDRERSRSPRQNNRKSGWNDPARTSRNLAPERIGDKSESGSSGSTGSSAGTNPSPSISSNAVTPLETKVRSVGDWSEHTSSSSKKYYYNCVSEVSQWEKPREWVEFERNRGNSSKPSCDNRNAGENTRNNLAGSNISNAIPLGSSAPISNSGHRSSRNPEKGANDRLTSTITSSLAGRGSDIMENYENARRSNRDRDRDHGHHRIGDRGQDHRSSSNTRTNNKLNNSRGHHNLHKSAGSSEYHTKNGGSTGTHPNDHDRDRHTHSIKDRHHQQSSHQNSVIDTDMEISSRDATPTSENEDSNNTIVKSHPTSHGKHDRDHHTSHNLSLNQQNHPSHHSGHNAIAQSAMQGHHSSSFPHSAALPQMTSQPEMDATNNHGHHQPTGNHSHSSHFHSGSSKGLLSSSQPLMSTTSTNADYCPGGPPTPTHSEVDHEIGGSGTSSRDAFSNSAAATPTTIPSSLNFNAALVVGGRSVTSATSVSTPCQSPLLSGGHGSKHQPFGPPLITPSLSRLYRESLISHVIGWPAESVEKACQRVNEDHSNLSNHHITRVSAELKMARSLVRLAEIQATLQEQRIMFLRQQSHDLDTMKTQTMLEATSGNITSASYANAACERITSLSGAAPAHASTLAHPASTVASGSTTVISASPAFTPSPHQNSCSGPGGVGSGISMHPPSSASFGPGGGIGSILSLAGGVTNSLGHNLMVNSSYINKQ